MKTIGDEVMIVSPDPATLTEWAVGYLGLFQERPQPRTGLHYGEAVYRDGDYFGGDVNLTHRVVDRALGGEVIVTRRSSTRSASPTTSSSSRSARSAGGLPGPAELFIVRASGGVEAAVPAPREELERAIRAVV